MTAASRLRKLAKAAARRRERKQTEPQTEAIRVQQQLHGAQPIIPMTPNR